MSVVAETKSAVLPRKQKRAKNSLYHNALREVQRLRAIEELDSDPVEALQELLDVAVAEFRLAQQRCLELEEDYIWRDTIAGKQANEWIRLRDEYFERLQRLTERMVALGIADRQVKVQEAQTLLVAQEVIAAAEEAGLSRTEVRALGAALRRRAKEGT